MICASIAALSWHASKHRERKDKQDTKEGQREREKAYHRVLDTVDVDHALVREVKENVVSLHGRLTSLPVP
jgi:hypothetical protein